MSTPRTYPYSYPSSGPGLGWSKADADPSVGTLAVASLATQGKASAASRAENTARLQRGRPFAPGQSGNPAGRPKGARNRSTLAAEALLEGQAEALTNKAIELALAGDATALRLCMERLLPARRERAVCLDLPAIKGADDVQRAVAVVLGAVGDGGITPSEASTLAGLIDTARSALGLDRQPAAPTPVVQVSFVGSQSETLLLGSAAGD